MLVINVSDHLIQSISDYCKRPPRPFTIVIYLVDNKFLILQSCKTDTSLLFAYAPTYHNHVLELPTVSQYTCVGVVS